MCSQPGVEKSFELDEFAVQKLNAVNKYGIIQGNVLGEVASLGACANVYQITDMERYCQQHQLSIQFLAVCVRCNMSRAEIWCFRPLLVCLKFETAAQVVNSIVDCLLRQVFLNS